MVLRHIFQGEFFIFLLFIGILSINVTPAECKLNESEKQLLALAEKCRNEVTDEFQKTLSAKILTLNQLFDTFYIPIPGTSPQKYNTQYDKITDQRLQRILDRYLASDKRLFFVVATDKNGYVPTHNSNFSKPLTDDTDYNAKNNRTKRIFNGRTGLAAARNTSPYLIQKYERDTGKSFYDLSVPIFIKNKHWGAIRIGYK